MSLRNRMACVALIVAALTASAGALPSTGIEDHSTRLANGELLLRQSVVLPISLTAAWSLVATGEGWMKWNAPLAHIEPYAGGTIEASYAHGARLGDTANIKHEIIAYVPESILVFRNTQSPPGFPWPIRFRNIANIIQVQSLDAGHTRITFDGSGFAADDRDMYAFFQKGNETLLERLGAYAARNDQESPAP